MRYLLLAGVLVTIAHAGVAQQPAITPPPAEGAPAAPECTAPTPVRPGGAARPVDSLCITRAAAIAGALAANPQLQISGAQTQQARARKVEGVALPDPAFSAEWDNSKAPFGIGGMTDKVVGASITVPFFDKFRLNGKIGTAGIRQSESDSAVVNQMIASATAQTYDSLLDALGHRANLREADSLAKDFATKTRARFDAGTVARLDVVNADVAIGQVENQLIANERDVANARSSLNRLLGRNLGAPITTADSLIVPPPLPDLAIVESAAVEHRPELASLKRQQEGAHATTNLAREFWTPDLTVGISKDFLGDPVPGYLSTAISFPIPILYWNHSRGEIAEDRYREDELQATYSDALAAVGQDVRAAYATADAALRQATYVRDQLLPAARLAYRIAASSYALGGLSALEVNTARSALLDAESQYTDALAAASSARSDLERAAGVPLATFGTGASR
ncbi:MAG TPA: TolC family protein [Gemmatimonadales bacterium]|jgi:cobalt-zinc-cadmium efflux system outer membrane protein